MLGIVGLSSGRFWTILEQGRGNQGGSGGNFPLGSCGGAAPNFEL